MKILYSARFEMVSLKVENKPFRVKDIKGLFPTYQTKNIHTMITYWALQGRLERIRCGLYKVIPN